MGLPTGEQEDPKADSNLIQRKEKRNGHAGAGPWQGDLNLAIILGEERRGGTRIHEKKKK